MIVFPQCFALLPQVSDIAVIVERQRVLPLYPSAVSDHKCTILGEGGGGGGKGSSDIITRCHIMAESISNGKQVAAKLALT